MAEIVILSDSNESVLSVDELNNKVEETNDKNKGKPTPDSSDSNDFDFPEVNFYHAINEKSAGELQNIDDKNCSPNYNPYVSYQAGANILTTNKISNRHETTKSLRKVTNFSDSAKESDEEKREIEIQKSKPIGKKNKSQLTAERLKRQEHVARERMLKTIASKKSKNIKPGECMKYVEVVLDKGIENFSFIGDIVRTLIDANLQYSISTELISNSITWKRKVENNYVNEANEISTVTDLQSINQIIIVWNWDETIQKIADGNFHASISSIRSSLPNYTMILIIFGIEDYFVCRKQRTNSKEETKNKIQKSRKKNIDKFKNFPDISRNQVETHLNELQVTAGCNSRLINTPQDLALMVYQCTKAIAEIPYKLEKNKNLTDKFDWYVMGDNRNTVRVDKDGNGLKRLWQQQVCQFSLSSLEIAEAICSAYPSPADLVDAYMSCTDNEGLNLLKDIPIRRAAGPLTAVRKVGPELSKKIYLMFMSKDGETVLS